MAAGENRHDKPGKVASDTGYQDPAKTPPQLNFKPHFRIVAMNKPPRPRGFCFAFRLQGSNPRFNGVLFAVVYDINIAIKPA